MTTISAEDLLAVIGGKSSSIHAGLFGFSQQQSPYESCIDKVEKQMKAEYPDSRPWYQFWGHDKNAAARGAATRAAMRGTCGLPPS